MRWDSLFADLEAQFEAAEALALDAEVAERVRIEVGTVSLADRFRGALAGGPRPLVVAVAGGTVLRGTVVDVGGDVVLLDEESGHQVLVPLRAVVTVAGLGRPARTEASAVQRRLGLRHALRRLGRDRRLVRVVTLQGEVRGTIDRVGADHLDLVDRRPGEVAVSPGSLTVPLDAVVAVWPG